VKQAKRTGESMVFMGVWKLDDVTVRRGSSPIKLKVA
jgi:hypothetical protein